MSLLFVNTKKSLNDYKLMKIRNLLTTETLRANINKLHLVSRVAMNGMQFLSLTVSRYLDFCCAFPVASIAEIFTIDSLTLMALRSICVTRGYYTIN